MLWFTAVSQLACCHRNWAPQTCASIERFLPLVSRTKKKKIEDFLRSVFPLWSSPLSFKLLLVKYIVKGVFKVPIFLLRLCARAQQFFVLLITGGCNFRVSVWEQLSEELKQSLKETMTKKYSQNSYDQVTKAVDKLQQEVCVWTVTQARSDPKAGFMEVKWSPNTRLSCSVQVLRQQRLVRLGREPLHSLWSRRQAGARQLL